MNSTSSNKITISTSDKKWLQEFEKKHHRAPRILHIGNIANNAYLNAKIQRKAGISAYVICYDYFHIMGNPEWEDADFMDGWGDDFSPDWSKVDLKDFKRPTWFIQDKFTECIKRQLSFFNTNTNTNKNLINIFKLLLFPVYLIKEIIIKLGHYGYIVCKNICKPLLKIKFFLRLAIYTLRTLSVIKIFLYKILSFIKRKLIYLYKKFLTHEGNIDFKFYQQLFLKFFPNRSDKLSINELTPYYSRIILWKKVFEDFDLVQAYALDGIYPLLSGKKYVAFEHGTIRNIPFENNTQGRVCALTYKAADNVIITNCDNIRSVEKLKLKNYQFIPHPINEEFLCIDERALSVRESLKSEYNSDFIIFHPSRHHWSEERHPDWEKGNDFLIKAFAKFIKEVNSQGLIIFVDWGACVNESKLLLKDLGIEDRVKWIKPLPNREMIRYIHASEIVADQFFLGAFGSTMPKALACKKAALIYIDESIHEWCFSEMPPVLNAQTENEIFLQLEKSYKDNDFYKKICEDGYQWYLKFHSNKLILDKTLNVYRELLS